MPGSQRKGEWEADLTVNDLVRIHPRAEIGTHPGSTFRILAVLAGAGINLWQPWGTDRNPTPYFGTVEHPYLRGYSVGCSYSRTLPVRQEVQRLPTPEVMDYKELKSYQARLIPSRMIDHRLSRIERLVLDAYIDLTTIDHVRKEDSKRTGLVNGPYAGTKHGMAPATTAKDIAEYWQHRGATISVKSVQTANRKLLQLGHIVRRGTGSGWIIGIPHSVRWWNDKTKDHISYRFSYWNDLFQQMDRNDSYD